MAQRMHFMVSWPVAPMRGCDHFLTMHARGAQMYESRSVKALPGLVVPVVRGVLRSIKPVLQSDWLVHDRGQH